jgi:hypothetical protein
MGGDGMRKQYSAILSMLRGGGWVSGREFLQAYIPTYSQRIGELRRMGYDIESTGRGRIASYRLREAAKAASSM